MHVLASDGSRRVRPLDVALPLSALVVTALALYGATARLGEPPVGALGWLLAPLLAVVLVARRRFPVGVLVVSICLVIGYYATGRPSIGLELPLAPAFVSVAERGRLWTGAVVAAALVGWTYTLRILVLDQELPLLLGIQAVTTIVVLAGALALGEAIHSRDRRRSAEAERDRLLAVRSREEVAARMHREREHIARDVHDVLGHTMVVIGMQADLALESGRSDETTRRALTTIREAARSALNELRESLAVVAQDPIDTRVPVTTVDDLGELIERVRATGLEVEWTVSGTARQLPVTVGSTAYRIAQESLTNVLRHSTSDRVTVRQEWATDRLLLEVADNGSTGARALPGNGIHGMRERAAMVGGHATAAYEQGRGFVVRVELPLPEARQDPR